MLYREAFNTSVYRVVISEEPEPETICVYILTLVPQK